MNRNQVTVVIKSPSGGSWTDAEFNVHHKVRHLLDKAVEYFTLDPRPQLPYQVLLVTGGERRSLPLDASIMDAGVGPGDILLIDFVGRTVDG